MPKMLRELVVWNVIALAVVLSFCMLHLFFAVQFLQSPVTPRPDLGEKVAATLYERGEFVRLRDLLSSCQRAMDDVYATAMNSLPSNQFARAGEFAFLAIWPLGNLVILWRIRKSERSAP